MTSPDPKPTTAHAARRKLVRGAFAAPALLTVYSGGALATGSAKKCLSNQTGTPTMPAVKDSTDTYVRVMLKKTGSYGNYSYWVSGSDLQTWKRATTTVYLGAGKWQPFNVSTNIAGVVQNTAPAGYSDSTKYAAVRFDASGNVVGVGIGGSQQSALAGTCWQSIAPTL